jgi:hypothetical protein
MIYCSELAPDACMRSYISSRKGVYSEKLMMLFWIVRAKHTDKYAFGKL